MRRDRGTRLSRCGSDATSEWTLATAVGTRRATRPASRDIVCRTSYPSQTARGGEHNGSEEAREDEGPQDDPQGQGYEEGFPPLDPPGEEARGGRDSPGGDRVRNRYPPRAGRTCEAPAIGRGFLLAGALPAGPRARARIPQAGSAADAEVGRLDGPETRGAGDAGVLTSCHGGRSGLRAGRDACGTICAQPLDQQLATGIVRIRPLDCERR